MRKFLVSTLCLVLLTNSGKSQKSLYFKFTKASVAIWDDKSKSFNRNYPYLEFDAIAEFKMDSSILIGTKEVSANNYKYHTYKWHEKTEKTNSMKTIKWTSYFLVQNNNNEYLIINLLRDKDNNVTSIELINFKAIVIYASDH